VVTEQERSPLVDVDRLPSEHLFDEFPLIFDHVEEH
jgi:hypothetical protein